MSLQELLRVHRIGVMPADPRERSRLTVRRKYILADTLHKLRSGLSLEKHLCVTFIGEPAVDEGT